MADWYPVRQADRVAWHANFSAQALLTGTNFGLSAGQITQIGVDAENVALIVNYAEAVSTFAQGFTAWKDLVFEATIGTPYDSPPMPPFELELAVGALPAIIARTRLYAGVVRAAPAYTPEIGEHYGIVGSTPAPPANPEAKATALTQSQIELKIAKAGYAVLAVDSRRGGGGWEQIGVSMTATYVDNRAPLVEGEPEVREYRVQGMENNARVGALSPIASAVTVP